jgi:hypothetical protein
MGNLEGNVLANRSVSAKSLKKRGLLLEQEVKGKPLWMDFIHEGEKRKQKAPEGCQCKEFGLLLTHINVLVCSLIKSWIISCAYHTFALPNNDICSLSHKRHNFLPYFQP